MKELGFNLINKNLIGARTFLGIFHDFAPLGGCICIKKEKRFEIKAFFVSFTSWKFFEWEGWNKKLNLTKDGHL